MRFLVALILLCAAPARAQDHTLLAQTHAPPTTAAFDGAAWRADLALIARELPARHPDLFFRMSRASWDSAVGAIDAGLPSMTRNEAMVAFMELVALVEDGHTLIIPLFDPAVGVRYYPLQLHAFDDGLYVRWAAPEHAALAGAKVLRIGRASAEEAMAAAVRTVPHENEGWARAWAPGRLFIAEILDGLGLVDDMENCRSSSRSAVDATRSSWGRRDGSCHRATTRIPASTSGAGPRCGTRGPHPSGCGTRIGPTGSNSWGPTERSTSPIAA
jgi:hypothetical protein